MERLEGRNDLACEQTLGQCVPVFEASPHGTRCHGRLPLTGEAIALGITAIIQRTRGGTPGDCLLRHHTPRLRWDCSPPPLPEKNRGKGEK
ncbi:hypothetical protein AALO_G00148300 [Alosa alosa]|uniref:Uncharacterized protein n=1 Tax=Alosa alosa TaxID=278164 RepID=A0AAV6GDC9_9TELE|nr:hypothetical protein AALO_G00148300 [Alosa alosa]